MSSSLANGSLIKCYRRSFVNLNGVFFPPAVSLWGLFGLKTKECVKVRENRAYDNGLHRDLQLLIIR